MEPDDWRIAVHRILRTDIYGYEMMPSGLKGIIAEMERRQQRAIPTWIRLKILVPSTACSRGNVSVKEMRLIYRY